MVLMNLVVSPVADTGPDLRALTIIMTLAALLVVFTRLWVRVKVVHNIGLDDWLMTFVMLIAVAGMGLVIGEIQYGVGRHMRDIPDEDIPKGLMLNLATQITYLFGICFAKISVGASLWRIASTRFWKNTITFCILGVFIYSTVGAIIILTQCSDVRALYDSSVEATCLPDSQVHAAAYANFSLNIVSDLVFALVIPVLMLWSIKISLRTKLYIFFVLGLGSFVCVCAVMRIIYLGDYGRSGDWLWDTVDLARWSVVELTVAIIAGSLPSLRPLFKRFLEGIHSRGSSARRTKENTTLPKDSGPRSMLSSSSHGHGTTKRFSRESCPSLPSSPLRPLDTANVRQSRGYAPMFSPERDGFMDLTGGEYEFEDRSPTTRADRPFAAGPGHSKALLHHHTIEEHEGLPISVHQRQDVWADDVSTPVPADARLRLESRRLGINLI